MPDIALFLGQALIGWLIADLKSGFVHWFLDRVACMDWKVFGPHVVVPNRVHHDDQLAFTTGSILRRNWAMWILVMIVSSVWLATLGPSVIWAFATFGAVVANEVHANAHRPTLAPKWLRVLQEIGILQSPQHHQGHHRAPTDRRYCTITNFVNPVLDGLRVWARLEWLLDRVGLPPHRGTR
jgi:hypothetical protein